MSSTDIDNLQDEKNRLKKKLEELQYLEKQTQIDYTNAIKRYNIAVMHRNLSKDQREKG